MSGLSTPPSGPVPEPGIYVPGSAQRAESYDLPEGSQGALPDYQPTVSADSSQTLYLNPADPNTAISTSPLVAGQPSYVQVSGTDFNEDDDYITLPALGD